MRVLDPGQRSVVWVADATTGGSRLLLETTDVLLEAPNWTLDGSALIVNGDGRLWRIPVDSPSLSEIPLTGVPDLNNDHVLDPDGAHIYLSANDGHIYRAALTGGAATRVTTRAGLWHFLHGVSPDGGELAFIGIDPAAGWGRADVWTVGVDGTGYRRLTEGPAPDDGCEYDPAGERLYFNTEMFDGHAQIARMPAGGGDPEQLTFDENVNWFPHLAPVGPYAVYVAFPPGTAGHPPDVEVDLMLVENGQWSQARRVVRAYGGQGTLNVNSWSPEGRAFAYVSHDRG